MFGQIDETKEKNKKETNRYTTHRRTKPNLIKLSLQMMMAKRANLARKSRQACGAVCEQ
jgi:hypothetical protein